jgi:predicted GTPase
MAAEHKTEKAKERVLILGAAGRDFHNFNTFYRNNSDVEVVGFTATQIPNIDDRLYPPSLSGPLYPKGLPILAESKLEEICKSHNVTKCVLSYSDLPYATVMEKASRSLSTGADFMLLGYQYTMIKSIKPVVAVTAVRTGCGKSQVSRYVIDTVMKAGKSICLVRHPMPYGDLAKQAVQRFEKYEDLAFHNVTIEEREEYEQHIQKGTIVWAGVDYEAILRRAEQEVDIVLWDGGNNDTPFYKPDLWIVIADPHRVGHESSYYPGDVNFRSADVIVINKANTAPAGSIDKIKAAAAKLNPKATVIVTNSEVIADKPELIKGKRCLVVDDGPTLTHGEMAFGAGSVACSKYEAAEMIDPRPFAKGSIKETLDKWSHIGNLVPAMGYFPEQIKDLEDTINCSDCDVVVIATPMDLTSLIKITKPFVVVNYRITDLVEPFLSGPVGAWLSKL